MTKSNILLVSNDQFLRLLVQDTLTLEGYRVDTVYKAINGLTLGLLKPPNVFLVDQSILDMTNIELIQRIKSRQELQAIPILAIADNLIQDQWQDCIHAGARGCLFKPFTGRQLVHFVREHAETQ